MPLVEETPADKTLRRWYELKMADRAAQIGHLLRGQRLLEWNTRKTANGTLGNADAQADKLLEGEDVIHIGDITYQAPSPEPASSQPASGLPAWAKAGMIGLTMLASGGMGAGLATYFATSDPPAASVGADSDTQYQLELGMPK